MTGLNWIATETAETLASFGITLDDADLVSPTRAARRINRVVPPELIDFLEALPVSITAGRVVFSHSGKRKLWPFGSDRDYIWGGRARPAGRRLRLSVHGHYPVERPILSGSYLCVDTEAWKTGLLSCAVIENGRCNLMGYRSPPTDALSSSASRKAYDPRGNPSVRLTAIRDRATGSDK